MEKASAEEVQQMITDTYEETVIKIAKPKKPFDPNKKKKPPREIIKYLRIKKKTSSKLRKRALTQKTREKLLRTLGPTTKEEKKPRKRRPGRE